MVGVRAVLCGAGVKSRRGAGNTASGRLTLAKAGTARKYYFRRGL